MYRQQRSKNPGLCSQYANPGPLFTAHKHYGTKPLGISILGAFPQSNNVKQGIRAIPGKPAHTSYQTPTQLATLPSWKICCSPCSFSLFIKLFGFTVMETRRVTESSTRTQASCLSEANSSQKKPSGDKHPNT